MTTALEGSEGSELRPGRYLPSGKTRYPLYKRLGGPQGRSGQVRKISPPPGFDPRTFQPVASRYTDCATRPIIVLYFKIIFFGILLLSILVTCRNQFDFYLLSFSSAGSTFTFFQKFLYTFYSQKGGTRPFF